MKTTYNKQIELLAESIYAKGADSLPVDTRSAEELRASWKEESKKESKKAKK
jgi:hypothetical protein